MTRLVVDGTNAMHRAYHAVRPSSYKGTPTNVITGFFGILLSKLRDYKATECVVTFDRPGHNFRHKLHPDYKGGRIKDPEKSKALEIQTPIIVKMLIAMGICVVGIRGVEADDIVAAAAVSYTGGKAYILSSDKDFAQCLVHKHIRLINPAKDIIVSRKNCKEVFLVEPKRMVDFLMLDGDKVDGIEGIPGIGGKTAVKLIEEFGKAEKIPFERFPKGAQETVNIKQRLKLNRKLITFALDAYDVSELDMSISPIDVKAFSKICDKYKLVTVKERAIAYQRH